MRVLGIDPGSRVAGFALLDHMEGKISYVESGVIRLKGELDTRLHQLATALEQIIHDNQPHCAAIETAFMHRNVKSLMVLCHARGVAIQTIIKHQISITHYEPRRVKMTVAGYGAANKSQVGYMIQTMLGLPSPLAEDASDAAAIAITHIQNLKVNA
jgi:crossover junction endodeoxyribonuclease RuvC